MSRTSSRNCCKSVITTSTRRRWALSTSMRSTRFRARAKTRRSPAMCRARECNRPRSEEHTSELQSLMRNSYADFCLKKKQHTHPVQLLIIFLDTFIATPQSENSHTHVPLKNSITETCRNKQ